MSRIKKPAPKPESTHQPEQFLAKSFKFLNSLVLVGWLPLFVLPTWQYTDAIVVAVVFVHCLAYVYFLIRGQSHEQGTYYQAKSNDFFELSGIVQMFSNPRNALVGWLHYLAFDLFVGFFILRDSQSLGISHWLMVPILFFSMMIGPLGLLLYAIVRVAFTLL